MEKYSDDIINFFFSLHNFTHHSFSEGGLCGYLS